MVTERPLPTRWQRFWHPEHDSTSAPSTKLTALFIAAVAVYEAAIIGDWLLGLFFALWAGSTWLHARSAQFSYRQGYWQAHIDTRNSMERAVRDGDIDAWLEREHDRIIALSMQWHAGTLPRWRRR